MSVDVLVKVQVHPVFPIPKSTSSRPAHPPRHKPMLSFLSLALDILRERVAEVREKGSIFTFTFVPDGQGDQGTACEKDQGWLSKDSATRGKGRVKLQGEAAWKFRSKWVILNDHTSGWKLRPI